MAWNGNNDSVNHQSSRNYMYNDKVFILDEITADNCAYLIGDLTTFVWNEANSGKRLMIYINSPGGDVYTMMTILGLINVAKLNDINVITFVLGLAGSAASILATQGNLRYMSNISTHFVHFGCIYDVTQKHSEIEKAYIQNKAYAEKMMLLYLKGCKGKLSRNTLLKLQSDERGYLSADECLKYGFCDVVIENELEDKLLKEKEDEAQQKAFEKYLAAKQKKSIKNGK